MRISTPVSDYIPASILTTQGDLVVRGAADPERLAAGALNELFEAQGAGVLPAFVAGILKATGVVVGNSSRSTSGSQVISGIGFQPSAIIFLASDNNQTNQNWAVGFDEPGTHMSLINYDGNTRTHIYVAACILISTSPGNELSVTNVTYGSDGFTLTWASNGTPPTVNFAYICLP